MVIFGAGGDLAKRLLIPALYNLTAQGLLGEDFKVLGVDRNARDEAAFRNGLGQFITELAETKTSEFGAERIDPAAWKHLSDRLFYQIGDFEDDAVYQRLAARIASLGGPGVGVLFYLAVAPRFFGDIVERLAKSGLTRERRGAYRRVVIEKPFGTDLASARALNRRILKHLDEPQIYRIDHFLGKETVRNVMVTRFANGVFEPLWNRDHIDHVQITAAETVGVEGRGDYYDHAGALRDMIPNHLMQILAMTAMEAPNTLDAAAISAERARAIEAVRVPGRAEALADGVRGQYRPGTVLGRPVVDYRHEPHVARRSRTETFVALKLRIDNQRWAGVPFYLRTGKAMSGRDTEVAIRFKNTPGGPFRSASGASPPPNTLVLQIQPQEGISIQFEAKRPGPEVHLSPVQMDFRYASAFGQAPSTGYETLIYDCRIGDRTLFKGADEIEYGWRAVQPYLDAWQDAGRVHGYAAGSDGPPQAEALLRRDGRSWRPVAT
jgi:glucose-6-phosphate 1-dehydrogenase